METPIARKLLGIDFTSAPSARKPITCAHCTLEAGVLRVERVQLLTSFEQFELLLHTEGPWLAACDFPFGQPRQLITALDWPLEWEGYVRHIAALGLPGFEATLARYREGRAPGDRHHLRICDRLAGAISPMMLYRIPVGKMFFQGAPRLLAAGVSIMPCHVTESDRVVVEGYPALVARYLVGKSGYKSDERKKQTEERRALRQKMVDGVREGRLLERYGVLVEMEEVLAHELVEDGSGDRLDAVLCAVQAAWLCETKGGVLEGDELEGWIADPLVKLQ